MNQTKDAAGLFSEGAAKGLEAFTWWADTNQRIFQQLVTFSAVAAKESARLYGDLVESNAQAISRSGDEFRATAQETVKGIQDSFTDLTARVRTLYGAAAN